MQRTLCLVTLLLGSVLGVGSLFAETSLLPGSEGEVPGYPGVIGELIQIDGHDAPDTPDALEVSLDKPRYKPGETAKVHLAPRFAGTALVTVVSDRLLAMKAVQVDASDAVIDLEVDDTWEVGAYVTATLFRPADRPLRHT